jgi:hypothetical protein
MKLLSIIFGLFNLFNLTYSYEDNITSYVCSDVYINITPILCYKYNKEFICDMINNKQQLFILNLDTETYNILLNGCSSYIPNTEHIKGSIKRTNKHPEKNFIIFIDNVFKSIYDVIINYIFIVLFDSVTFYILYKFNNIRIKQIAIRNIIKKNTTKIKYDKELDICTICFDEYDYYSDIRKLINCRHNYHEKCIKEWIVTYNKNDCPVCRTPIKID